MTNVPMRAQDSFRQCFLFGGGADILHFLNRGQGIGNSISESRVDVLVPLRTLWHLEVYLGTRDLSKQLLEIVAFDSEL